jgi:hypothetical protein
MVKIQSAPTLIETALQIQGLVTKPMRELIRQYLKNARLKNM